MARSRTSSPAPSPQKQEHLGRNPFAKARKRETFGRVKEEQEEATSASASEWLFVKLPADTMVFAIKTAILMKESFTKKR